MKKGTKFQNISEEINGNVKTTLEGMEVGTGLVLRSTAGDASSMCFVPNEMIEPETETDQDGTVREKPVQANNP